MDANLEPECRRRKGIPVDPEHIRDVLVRVQIIALLRVVRLTEPADDGPSFERRPRRLDPDLSILVAHGATGSWQPGDEFPILDYQSIQARIERVERRLQAET